MIPGVLRDMPVHAVVAADGINVQFCWLMGRMHCYGQEHDYLTLNFVTVNTA